MNNLSESSINYELIPQMRTIKEISEEFKLAYGFIRQLCLEDKIIFTKAGKKYLINRQKFIDFLNSK